MMSTKKRLVKAAQAGTLCVLAGLLQSNVQAGADSLVPEAWNVGPMTNGAYLESFDGSLPGWANRVGYNTVTNVFLPTMGASGLPARSNAWFGANAKVMQLETAGEVVTNSLLYQDDTTAVTFASQPVYVDLRMKFDPLAVVPDGDLLGNVKMALYVSSDFKLVAVHSGGSQTNATAVIDTNKWYQITVKLQAGAFDVLLNDEVVFSGLNVKNSGIANTLSSANFYGTGMIDELYVSHGNPAYLIPGPTTTVPALPSGSNPPTEEELTQVNAWLSEAGVTTLGSLSQEQVNTAYLLDNHTGSTVVAVTGYELGISQIELVSPTVLTVTASLKVDDVSKVGPINGKIQLLGKVNFADASWVTLGDAITPSFANFTAGKATYTFTIPAGGYKFFKPTIVP